MARVTVEDCLKNVKNRFELVIVAAKRARQLMRGKTAMVEWDNDKATVVALREIAAGYTDFDHKHEHEEETHTLHVTETEIAITIQETEEPDTDAPAADADATDNVEPETDVPATSEPSTDEQKNIANQE